MNVRVVGEIASDDADLLDGLRRADRRCLADLAKRYGSKLAQAAYSYVRDGHAAEDLAQEALISAWDSAGRALPETQLRPWIFGILFNHCRKYRRSLWRRLRRERASVELGAALAAEGGEKRDRLERLDRAMAQLPDVLREVVILRFQQEMSVAQAAEALGLAQGTVKSRTHTAMQKLKAYMEKEHDRG